jgi:hypothetical protein
MKPGTSFGVGSPSSPGQPLFELPSPDDVAAAARA